MKQKTSLKKFWCVICGGQLVKIGFNRSGTRLWKCKECSATTTRTNERKTRETEFRMFLSWLLGKSNQAEHTEFKQMSSRTFRRKTAWCWRVLPVLEAIPASIVEIDGIHVGKHIKGKNKLANKLRCALIAQCAISKHPLAIHWCQEETVKDWKMLLNQLASVPEVIVCDGGNGISTALYETYEYDEPKPSIQRCLIHLNRNIKTMLNSASGRAHYEARKSLKQLGKDARLAKNLEEAETWEKLFEQWHSVYKETLDETSPYLVTKANKKGYRHKGLRDAYNHLNTVKTRGHLFTFLEHEGCPDNTNLIEGDTNGQIRYQLRNHRGLKLEREKISIGWHLWERSGKTINDATKLLKPEHWQNQPTEKEPEKEQIGPKYLDNSYEIKKTHSGKNWYDIYQ